MRFQLFGKLAVWLVVFTFGFAGVTPAFSGSRVMPTGTVKVFDGNKLVQVLKQESPLPNGALLTPQGRCGVRMENLYLVAEDGALFGVIDATKGIVLRVEKGVVYFAITQDTGQLTFHTPAGLISTLEAQLNAAGNGGLLKGYVDVSGTDVQLGVLDGGNLLVSTGLGEKRVQPGKRIILAIADPIKKDDKQATAEDQETATAEEEDDDDKIPAAYFIGGGIGLAGGLGYAIAQTRSSPGPASPVSP